MGRPSESRDAVGGAAVDRRPRRAGARHVFLALGALLGVDAALLWREASSPPRSDDGLAAAAAGFVGGHALSAAWSVHGLDRRGSSVCECELFPIVGAPCCDPGHRHSGRVSTSPPSEAHPGP